MTLIRVADVATVAGDGRSVDVRLVPWDTWADVSDDGVVRYQERFARGALEPGRAPLLVRDGHENGPGGVRYGSVIGHVDGVESRPDGAYATLRIAETSEGVRTLALVRNGTVRAVSIEFSPVEDAADGPGQVTRVRARLDGVAFVSHPAHDSPVLAVRNGVPMETTIPAPEPVPAAPTLPVAPAGPIPAPPSAPVDLLDEGARARAAAATLSQQPGPVVAVRAETAPFSTLGHLVRALAQRDPAAQSYARAIAVNTTVENTGVTPPAWIGEVFGIVAAARPGWEAFRGRPLPPTGMVVNYPQVTSKPLVGAQATEKTEVASQKFTVDETGSPVKTYAGGENVSLQLALRSDPSYTDALWRAFAMEYAAVTDAAFIAAALTATTQTSPVGLDLAAATADEWWAALVKAAGKVMRGSMQAPNVVVVSTNIWEILAAFTDTDGRPIFPAGINNPQNALGQTSLAEAGNIGGLNWVVDPHAADDTALVAWAGAMEHLESPGAPLRLTTEEAAILGREVAVYGFVAFAAAWPGGMCKLVAGTPTALGATRQKAK